MGMVNLKLVHSNCCLDFIDCFLRKILKESEFDLASFLSSMCSMEHIETSFLVLCKQLSSNQALFSFDS